MAGSITKPKKPQSKRGTTRLRHKIEKKSAAKQRKDRKNAKKNPEWRSKLKKDPGIPNLFPYKERLLQEIEEKRIRKEEETRKRREAAKAARTGQVDPTTPTGAAGQDGMDEDGSDGEKFDAEDDDMMDDDGDDVDESDPMAALLASARRAAEDYEQGLQSGEDMDDDDDDDGDSDDDETSGAVSVGGDATSRRAYDKVFKQVVEQADVILYVLDARDPEGTRSRDVERAVLSAAAGGKRLILILNKIDLIPPPVLKAWLLHLRKYFPTLPLRASNPAANAHTFNHRDLTVQGTSATLFRALKAFAAGRNMKRAISVGVIGYPNVGKSSVINALLSRLSGRGGSSRSACPAGAEAGVTTSIRAVKIDSKLTLLDSPGIVFPSTSDVGSSSTSTFVPRNATEAKAHLVLLNAVPPKHIDDPIPAVQLLLKRLSTSPDLMKQLAKLYDLPALLPNPENGDATTDFLVQVARRRGRMGRGGVPNINAAAMTVVTDWRDGRIQGWVDAPVTVVAAAAAAAAAAPVAGASGSAAEAAPVLSGIKIPSAAPAVEAAADQKHIVTEWAAEFKLEGLWGDDSTPVSKEVDMQG
ncbi:P-loop containing nucleoside triphosphate hydrolase protein [Coniella lustricola]|uniref:P-loop containing nucleoside triphosphate hydrolase protein n=1 Tax=Coniella lustricola TaxID=2025994 RepID=A0A2T2ZTW1_9PEZI|nr:P-loop containing nucleoside triphosphate hydrolase protein [Coniella lustricola]